MKVYSIKLKLIEEGENQYVKFELNPNEYSDFIEFKKTALACSLASFLNSYEYYENGANRNIKGKIAQHNLALFLKVMSTKLSIMIDNEPEYNFISYRTSLFAHRESSIRIKLTISHMKLVDWLTRLYSMDNFYKVSDIFFTNEEPTVEGIHLIVSEYDFVSVLMNIADFTTIIL